MRQQIIFMILALCTGLVQCQAVVSQVDSVVNLPSPFVGFLSITAISTPILGAAVCFFGAKDVWGWHWGWAAALSILGGYGAMALSWVLSKIFGYDDQ